MYHDFCVDSCGGKEYGWTLPKAFRTEPEVGDKSPLSFAIIGDLG